MQTQDTYPADLSCRQRLAPVRRQYHRFVLPSLAAMVVFSLYTMVDGYFVARYVGPHALSAVSLAMPFVNAFFALGIFFAVGTQAHCAVLLGQQRIEKAQEIFSLSFQGALLFSVPLAALSYLAVPWIARLLGAGGSLLPLVSDYLRVVLIFAPCFICSYTLEVMVKTDGQPSLAALGVLAAAAANIFLDWLMVGRLGWGVRGAALATGLSQLLSLLFFLCHFLQGRARLRLIRVRFDGNRLLGLCRLGLGDFFSEIGIGVTVFLYNYSILHLLGEKYLAAFSVISYVNLLADTCFFGIAQGIQPLISYYYGGRDEESANYTLKLAFRSTTLLAIMASVICFFGGPQIFSLYFGPDWPLLAYSSGALRIFALSFFFGGCNILLATYSVALLLGRSSVLIHFFRSILFPALALAVLGSFGSELIWCGALAAQGLTLLCLTPCVYRQSRKVWKRAALTSGNG